MDYKKILDIIAYYLSEFDMRAFEALGFHTQAEGFESIASAFGKKSSYLRRLRDEYDVITNSTRMGQRNREPRTRIIETKSYLIGFSFDELTGIVKAFIDNSRPGEYVSEKEASKLEEKPLSETEIETILNFKDPGATIRVKATDSKVRIYNTSIIKQLKKLYGGCCQLCGQHPMPDHDVDICEAHHIAYFSETQNNDASNIIVVCPNHHRLLHKLNPVFEPEYGRFRFEDGKNIEIKFDLHLMR